MKVVIIGGGVAGLSIGWRLVQSGCAVTVLERAQPGRGATWASGGMIAAAAEHGDSGAPEDNFARHSAQLWPEFAARIERESRREIFYRRMGSLIVAPSRPTPGDVPDGITVLSGEDARGLEPLLGTHIASALWAPDDAQVDNRQLGLALALAFINAGGALQTNEAVVHFEMEGDRVKGARTPFTLHEGDVFIIAAGAWSGEIVGIPRETAPPVVPVKGEMIALMPPDGAMLPAHLVWGEGVYLIPRHGQLFVGATVENAGFDTSVTDTARAWLLKGASALMPTLRDWPVVEHWAGLRPGSPDDRPILGETSIQGLFVASGQYRNGILFAPAIAEALYSLVVEQRVPREVEAFAARRFHGGALVGAGALR